MDFSKIKHVVAKKFSEMQKTDIFKVDIEGDELWNTYLSSFPEGTNPMYRERTEHDCSCCRSFIKTVGGLVTIKDGQLSSIWDVVSDEPGYQVVADELSRLVKSKEIDNIFLSTERNVGTDKNREFLETATKTWEHFYVNIDKKFQCTGVEIGPRKSNAQATHDVMYRGLNEITLEALDAVLELISQNSIYRGEEHKVSVEKFRDIKKKFVKVQDKHAFVWENMNTVHQAAARIRNTAIGTLLIDISNDVDIEVAVAAFERMVAPQNYKRPTALVTKSMVDAAKKKIEELGLTSALERRYANISDITINNIIFADREAKKSITGDVFDEISTKAISTKKIDKVEEVSIDKFLKDIVPKASSIEIFVENKHTNNFVSLVAPVDPTANNMFKWGNQFSWSYNGDMADSIKERVKKAGGNVTGDLCCRLAWYNHDDLDFHMIEPNKYEIYFGNKGHQSPSRGTLDVDMNAGGGTTRTPVENIYYKDKKQMKEGIYKLFVHQYSKRDSQDPGFEVEIDFMGTVYNFVYPKTMTIGAKVVVAEFNYSHANGIEMINSLPNTQSSKDVWNVKTQDFHKVSVIMNSPNYWDEQGVGNKHLFFMIDGCQNDGKARGFFNEFLKDELTPHRKVIEMVGSKMRTEESVNQLSGLGFSSTQKNEILVRVKGAFTRTIKVVI